MALQGEEGDMVEGDEEWHDVLGEEKKGFFISLLVLTLLHRMELPKEIFLK